MTDIKLLYMHVLLGSVLHLQGIMQHMLGETMLWERCFPWMCEYELSLKMDPF